MGEVTKINAGGAKLAPPAPISDELDRSRFDCGNDELNQWFRRQAIKSESRTSRTYVVRSGGDIAGFYCISAGSVFRKELPTAKLRRNTPDSVPVVVIGRLAVDTRFQGAKIGKGMLKDALTRAISFAEEIGVLAVIVHAIDDDAVLFYQRFNFQISPTNDRTLILPISVAIEAIKG